ncbi:TraX family protein [Stenotrophomonas rhizophila]|uniref:TraX family protein n=1 Tax=Stenotrophomonas rhizophila TaxID=216778 RepID=UPI0028A6A96D|nr:TraX family protein [Stenotrophomonas rhizophila]
MTSSGREFLKWLAVLLMTGDHALKVFDLGYVPVVTELGRVAFPVFALVMAYNLAQPGADAGRSVRRLALWASIAQPVHAFAFGYWLPLNVLATFVVAAGSIWALQRRNWPVLVGLLILAPAFVDYGWAGVWLVVAAYGWFCSHGKRMHWLLGCGDFRRSRLYLVLPIWVWICMSLLCLYNGNAWALLAIPLMQLGELRWPIPRTRWAFYGYYVGHLALLCLLALLVS